MNKRYRHALGSLLALIFGLVATIGCDSAAESDKNDDNAESAESLLNLSFEQVDSGQKPLKWYVGGDGYNIEVDISSAHRGAKSLRISYASGDAFGVATQSFPLGDALGKTIRFSGYIKSETISRIFIYTYWWRSFFTS